MLIGATASTDGYCSSREIEMRRSTFSAIALLVSAAAQPVLAADMPTKTPMVGGHPPLVGLDSISAATSGTAGEDQKTR